MLGWKLQNASSMGAFCTCNILEVLGILYGNYLKENPICEER
jgi:hypothetical protein